MKPLEADITEPPRRIAEIGDKVWLLSEGLWAEVLTCTFGHYYDDKDGRWTYGVNGYRIKWSRDMPGNKVRQVSQNVKTKDVSFERQKPKRLRTL